MKYGILFIFSLFYEYSNLEYVHFHVLYRVIQADYVIRILVAAAQEYVNTYSTRRVLCSNVSNETQKDGLRVNPKMFVHFYSFVHESIVLSCFRFTCITHTAAIPLHDYWAMNDPPLDPLLYAIHLTILIITILCKG